MNWKEIKVNIENTGFLYKGEAVFKEFISVLKFHEPGIAPVEDNDGWYHIKVDGQAIYNKRYTKAFGYYFDCASVVDAKKWFHIDISGKRIYTEDYAWCGNYQQCLCTVRNNKSEYFHIDIKGEPAYKERYIYAGDYYDNICCVKTSKGWKHIQTDGSDLNGKYFQDLGVFHKGFATARDNKGWFHIDKDGNEIYDQRYLSIEPFYNSFALVTKFDFQKIIIDERGNEVISL